ncbi:MAG: MFS transporter [Aliishimia sp.]
MDSAPQTHKARKIHPAWGVAFAGAVAIFCGLGLGRFAFGMMLPSMSISLGLDYDQGGLLGFANMLGYLFSVLIMPFVLRRLGTRLTASFSLVLMALSMFGMALSENFLVLCSFYLFTGLGSGGVVLPTMSVMSQWFAPSHRGLASGIAMSGPGFGIILSGFVVPKLIPFAGLHSWQSGWLIFGAITAAVSLLAYAFIRNHPRDLGFDAFGKTPGTLTEHVPTFTPRARVKLLAHLGIVFGIYGATYMLYVTFIVTSMVDSYGMSQQDAGWLWAIFGLLSIFSGVVFGSISDKIGRRMGMAVAFSVLATSYLLVGFSSSIMALYLSIFLFGIAAWSIPVIMAASCGDFFGPAAAASALAILMMVFSVGQGTGPVIAGFVAERSGTFSASYASAGIAALIAVALAFLLRPPQTTD